MKRVLFIDRDGTMILEQPPTYQIDSLEKVVFYPKVFKYLGKIAAELDYELVLVSNQDGLGTGSFPEETFHPAHNHIINTFAGEGIVFSREHIDRSFPADNLPTRKPGIGMLKEYFTEGYDLANSFVIGDRITDVKLAQNLGAKAIWLKMDASLGASETTGEEELKDVVALETTDWAKIYEFLKIGLRTVSHTRTTKETDIRIELNLDGTGKADIQTGLGFFDHMLDQIARHGSIDLKIHAKGDLHIDEHHTIEDTGLALGEAFAMALADKKGMERYGFCLPMDDCLAQAAIDFGGRNWIVWDAEFKREKIGEMPTEMFFHFFKSFSDAARCNLNIKAEGDNEHHKIEAIFKVFAKAIKMAVKRNPDNMQLPSTKGVL
ncbi:bifunctional histidinol-phosphatase/imidazoleglycerol-phosphate dehydratase HisB [Chitinophaga deserti]|uniref:bifunctional histidinol-phosphatase/imidazoleglycerol-phosphate dehydratase HisB n=1 Tax=Chitinophaga deserti TaxID=2164099 RepID=UPI000D6C5339|nr:bifunctional histidinol-phosphatase/imidazoleglycerol-phosphate dehydratase HisB [Chitinophaga deserti]